MPTKIDNDKEQKWITVGGRKIPIDPDKSAEEQIREKLPSARGEKESRTKQAKKAYVQRYNIIKSPFKIRDEVVFDKFEKSGILYGFDGDYVRIISKSGHYNKLANDVFKKSEIIDNRHWDTMDNGDRVSILKSLNISNTYIGKDWKNIPQNIRKIILKNLGPAGYEGGVSTTTTGVYNPVNDDKSISERVKESMEERGKKDKEKRENDAKTIQSGSTNVF